MDKVSEPLFIRTITKGVDVILDFERDIQKLQHLRWLLRQGVSKQMRERGLRRVTDKKGRTLWNHPYGLRIMKRKENG